MTGEGRRWTREQLVVAFALYCKTQFGKMHRGNPEIVEVAKRIERTPSSLAMKLVNFASLDPAIIASGRKGLGNASAADKQIWDEFHANWDRVAVESSRILEPSVNQKRSDSEELEERLQDFGAEARRAFVEVRTKQSFFRDTVVSSYQGRCCMSGLAVPSLLNASHIVPWKIDRSNRLNPRNGLSLSTLHDRAFDRGLISVRPDYRIIVSRRLKAAKRDPFLASSLLALEDRMIALPEKFHPDKRFLEYHFTKVFGN
ncbi:MAG: HNH endonuclease [Pseudomonadota bacterium]